MLVSTAGGCCWLVEAGQDILSIEVPFSLTYGKHKKEGSAMIEHKLCLDEVSHSISNF